MKTLLVFLMSVIGVSSHAQGYPTTIPCDSNSNSLALIVQRPPTADELSAFVPSAQFGHPTNQLVLMSDYITCDGSNWNLTQTVQVTQPLNRP